MTDYDRIAWIILDAASTVLLACGGAGLRAGTFGAGVVGLVAVVVALGLWTASAGQRFELQGESDGQR